MVKLKENCAKNRQVLNDKTVTFLETWRKSCRRPKLSNSNRERERKDKKTRLINFLREKKICNFFVCCSRLRQHRMSVHFYFPRSRLKIGNARTTPNSLALEGKQSKKENFFKKVKVNSSPPQAFGWRNIWQQNCQIALL